VRKASVGFQEHHLLHASKTPYITIVCIISETDCDQGDQTPGH